MKNNTLFETFIIFVLGMINLMLVIFTDEREIILSGGGLTKMLAMSIIVPLVFFVIFNTWRNDNSGKLKYSWIVGLVMLYFTIKDFEYLKYAMILPVALIIASVISLYNYRKNKKEEK